MVPIRNKHSRCLRIQTRLNTLKRSSNVTENSQSVIIHATIQNQEEIVQQLVSLEQIRRDLRKQVLLENYKCEEFYLARYL